MDERQSSDAIADESNRFHVEQGMRFQRWTAVRYVSGNRSKAIWVCECDCGTTRAVTMRDVVAGKSKSCGCTKGEAIRQDLTGKRFGSLVVVGLFERSTHGTSPKWRCVCDCGRESFPTAKNLRNGNSTTCGDGMAHRCDHRVTERIQSGTKVCCRCKATKPFSEFYRKRTRDGHGSHCKVCNREKNIARAALRLESDRESSDRWRRENAEHIRAKGKSWYATNSSDIQCRRRNSPAFQQAKHRDRLIGKQRFARRAKLMWKGTQLRCKQGGIQFSLTPEFIEKQLRCGCAATGITFDLLSTRGPFSPSIDRITAGGPYSEDNVQVVVWCYNAAKGTWGKEDVVRMARALLKLENKHGRASDECESEASAKVRQRRIEFVA